MADDPTMLNAVSEALDPYLIALEVGGPTREKVAEGVTARLVGFWGAGLAAAQPAPANPVSSGNGSDTCPVCGTPGEYVTSDEGTSYFSATQPALAAPDVDCNCTPGYPHKRKADPTQAHSVRISTMPDPQPTPAACTEPGCGQPESGSRHRTAAAHDCMTPDRHHPYRIAQPAPAAPSDALREALEGMVRQFAYWAEGDTPGLWTGGLSALEDAFDALGWEGDVHPAPDMQCDEPGCRKQAGCGFSTRPGGTGLNGGYRWTCFDHSKFAEGAR